MTQKAENRPAPRTKGRILVFLAAGVVAIMLFSSLIRSVLVPISLTVLSTVPMSQTYRQHFSPLGGALASVNVPIGNAPLIPDCQVLGYENIRETVMCHMHMQHRLDSVPKSFKTKWKRDASKLEAQLQHEGWIKIHDASQPIEDIFSYPNKDTSTGVNYQKKNGRITCTLTAMYLPNPQGTDGEPTDNFYVGQVCERYFALFGGY